MTYNLNDQKQYMQALDFIEIAKQNKWHVTLEKKRERCRCLDISTRHIFWYVKNIVTNCYVDIS